TTGLEYEALARGMATEKDYEEVARRSLALQLRMGDMDQLGLQNPFLVNPTARYLANRAAQRVVNKEVALEASQEQIVLLKNDGILPLSGEDVSKAVLLGPQSDQVLKDFYSGSYGYFITIKDALENKLGASNVFFNRAIDTVAIKSVSNGMYLTGGTSTTVSNSGSSGNAQVAVNGTTKPTSVNDTTNRAALFEVYDYGSTNWLMRTPVNGRYVQVANGGSGNTNQNATRAMYNNTTAPAEGLLNQTTSGQNLQYSNFQKFRLIPTDDGHTAIYHLLSGNGINGGTPLAYDVDDEDINRGSYLYVTTANPARVQADVVNTNGPWQSEYNVTSRVDTVPNDGMIDNLPNNSFKFDFEPIQTVEQAANAAIAAAADPTAPIILVVGTEPHTNSREGVDLYKTGLSAQQMRLINYVTNDLSRDVIVLIKTGNPMTIDKTVQNNPRVKAILVIGATGQEEGSAIVSALFDDGYSVPATGWSPANTGIFTMNTGSGTNGPNQPFPSYPGYLPSTTNRTIPAYAPAGRLSATWYDGISQMLGASEEHPPASFVYPPFDEVTNDNMSNMNGTIPTGLLTYDIIKGERTYMYLNAKPLYAFGHGLTYTPFTYSDLAVSAVSNGKFTVSGKVTNAGTKYTSDEVVQIYSTFAGTPSRIKQPNLKLIAFDRIKKIAPGETRSFSFDVDLVDTLGVWDVETEDYIVEPGNYSIKAASASDQSGAVVTLNVTGPATPQRDLSKFTLAVNYDDYSNVGGKIDDIEIISATIEYTSNEALQFRKNGAWANYKDVVFDAAPAVLTIKSGSDRAGSLKVYALPSGANPATLSTATPVATLDVVNTRKGVSAVNLGIGPVGRAATPTAAGAAIFPGSNDGQAYKDNYIKPEYVVSTIPVSGISAGVKYDIYIVTENRGTVLEWVKFGTAPVETEKVEIYNIYSANSIREAGGELVLTCTLTPAASAQSIEWSVENESGEGAPLATIDAVGVLKATGAANGYVIVTAKSGAAVGTLRVMVTNQLTSNRVTISNAQRTVEYLMMRTGTSWSGDSISTHAGTLTMGLACRGIFAEVGYVNQDSYLTVTNASATWSISDMDGNPTSLATVTAAGVVAATGVGNGKVLVKATLINNPDIFVTRAITLTGQRGEKKDPYKMIQLKDNNFNSTGMGAATTTYASGGNEIGFYSSTTATSRAGFANVDFGSDRAADRFYIRIASTAAANVAIWIDGYSSATGGTQVGTLALPSTGSTSTYRTHTAALTNIVTGVHDLYLVFSTGATRANWFQFTGFEFDHSADLESFNFGGEKFNTTKGVYSYDVNIPTSKTSITATDFSVSSVVAEFPELVDISMTLSPTSGAVSAGAPCVASVVVTSKEYPELTRTYTINFGYMSVGNLAFVAGQSADTVASEIRFSDGATSFKLYYAVYDANGRMVSVTTKDFDAIDKHQAGTVSSQFDPPTIPGAKVKVFLWDQNFIPLVANLSK
ncbi:MAG: glycoside hydrolase family 3 C-terminal domain-containing protein, partial [Oscillospiraceae bacterium]|nr:glycoside hydrolase family 3 C-terminal domain-containing protein [Oscillospiraceae bacterium]